MEKIQVFLKMNFVILPNIDSSHFLSLMQSSDVMVGNSSAGIREAPSFSLPVVNIGSRQNERLRAANVVDVPFDNLKIYSAINKCLYDTDFIGKLSNIHSG